MGTDQQPISTSVGTVQQTVLPQETVLIGSVDPYNEKIIRIAEIYQSDQQKKLTCTIKGEEFSLEQVMYAFARNETSSLKP
jgi:predicted secreted protein